MKWAEWSWDGKQLVGAFQQPQENENRIGSFKVTEQ